MNDSIITAFNLHYRNVASNGFVEIVVDKVGYAILNIILRNKPDLIRIFSTFKGYGCVGKLVDLVSFKGIY